MSKGFEIVSELPDLSYTNSTRFLHALGLIDNSTYKELEGIRKQRNKLDHDPGAHLTFQEQDLFELMLNIEEFSWSSKK